MNETNCDRCNEVPAETLIEHVLYGEAVCHACMKDEDAAWETRNLQTWGEHNGEQR